MIDELPVDYELLNDSTKQDLYNKVNSLINTENSSTQKLF